MLVILVAEAAVADPDDVADNGGCIDGTTAASGFILETQEREM